MNYLILDGTDVPVVQGTRLTEERVGDVGRVASLQIRSDTVGVVRVIQAVTSELNASEMAALRTILKGTGNVAVSGTIVEDESPAPEFTLVGPIEVDAINGIDAWVLSFELHEAEAK